MNAAATFLDKLITNPITVNIQVGWQEDDNGAYPIGDNLSLGGALAWQSLAYSQLKSALIGSGSAADAFAATHLPATSGSYFVSNAEAQALGLLPADPGSQIEGAVGFNDAAWNYNSSQPVPRDSWTS